VRVFLLPLGCAKNRVDLERLAERLVREGHELASAAEEAEGLIVSTCAFIEPAVRESVDAVLEGETWRAAKDGRRVVLYGCLVNRYGEEALRADLPAVDAFVRCEDFRPVLEALAPDRGAARGGAGAGAPPCARALLPGGSPLVRYLKVAEGCDNRCSYCAIPSIRGGLRSLPVPDLVREAESLIAVGAKEIALVAQDLTVYGRDRGEEGLIPLLDALEPSLPGDVRLRLLYLHPARVGAPLLERIATSPRILRYLDIPIQHADPAILSAMGRPASEAELSLPFETARAIDPDFALRTTCMVGFPGEDARAFAALSRFLERIRFDRVGAFTYWPEEGTRAAALPGQIPGATKTRRMNRLLALQDRISSERGERFVGRVLECLVERVEPAEGWGEGRTFREAPEVDGRVEIRNPRADLRPGERIALRVLLAGEQDLVGEEVEAS